MYRDDHQEANLTSAKYKKSMLYSLLLLLFLSAVLAIVYLTSSNNIAKQREMRQYAELGNMQASLLAELNIVGTDLAYYAHSELAISTLQDKEPQAKRYLTSLMFQIGNLYKHYDQIRLLNDEGDEVIRIDQLRDDSLYLVPDEALQNKADRYYFRELAGLRPQEIYASPFDLNVEHGEVELPFKPTIRFATPIYGPAGDFIGAGVINYQGKDLLQIIEALNVHEHDKAYLLNGKGFYLMADQADKEWRFMFPEREQLKFGDDHPVAWRKMQQAELGKVVTDDGEYYFSRFQLAPDSLFTIVNKESAYLVMFVPESKIQATQQNLNNSALIAFLLVSPMFVFLAYKLASAQVEQQRLFSQLTFDARHDALTGLYNRSAIIEYLGKNISQSRRQKSDLAVSFIDVNDLKRTNDLHGHEAGDDLLRGVAEVINMSIRNGDFAARIGGDEFLIVFVDCDGRCANDIMERIQAAYGVMGLGKTGKAWSLSFGCTQLLHETDDVDSIIERADSLMYEHKMGQKNQQMP
ncbi:sensor domain-containing diguanylate cyclase [Shewanella aquimarina]|uniref:sensor domain-containing diguanylate cyclase n=1 Tax=Shewanella aquimarina TaxID=260365 RepID=UPI002014ED22|nr:sensor domain-containing diguanylate cyclase [Shewanella aquimarina]MCL2909136.1 sensor domain-containing diguanylate cyclase [Shewanella aquimarina]